MPYIIHSISPNPPHDVLPNLPKSALLRVVKVDKLDPIIDLCSELDGDSLWALYSHPWNNVITTKFFSVSCNKF